MPSRTLICGLMVGMLAACAAPVPSPSPPASASAIPSAAPAAEAPAIRCPNVVINDAPRTTLTCKAAIQAALAALPSSEPLLIQRIEFHYGSYCPPGLRCGFVVPLMDGYVVFRTEGRISDLWVTVAMDESGAVSVTSGLAEFPPYLGTSNRVRSSAAVGT